jgi:hypothetical protein
VNTKLVIDRSSELREASERALHVVFACLGVPKSYLDVYCAHGFLVRAARMFGCDPALGLAVDINTKRAARRYAILVMKAARDVSGEFDLVTCFQGQVDADIERLVASNGHLILGPPFTFVKGGVQEANGLTLDQHKTQDLQSAWTRAELGPLPPTVQVYVRA